MHARHLRLFTLIGAGLLALGACHSAPPVPAIPPAPLSDSATAALDWIGPNATPFHPTDSVASAAERRGLAALAEGARVIGLSEMTEGTHEFPYIVRRALFALADTARVRGLAIQAPMPEAMFVDRYVRTGVGDPERLLETLGSWRWDTREMRALVEAMRAWNRRRAPDEQVGFYGFEIPTAARAVAVVTSLPETVTGAPLKAWLAAQYGCVALNEGAHFGREGRTADSAYWNACRPATEAALDSIVALRRRLSARSPAASDVAFAEQMARLIAHHVRVGLEHLAREEGNAEHVVYLADLVGANNKLLLWGGDAEAGRITLDQRLVQTGTALDKRLGARYRSIAYAVGDGEVRTHTGSPRLTDDASGLSDVRLRPPQPDTFEDVLIRVSRDGYWIDMRSPPAGLGAAWLAGPRPLRIITQLYSSMAPDLFQAPVELPRNFDAVVFVRHVRAARN